MSKTYANVITSGVGTASFAGFFERVNELTFDLGNSIITASNVNIANSTNDAQTSGNAYLNGVWSSDTIRTSTLTGGGGNGHFANVQNLHIASNVNIGNSTSSDNLTVYGDTTLTSNVTMNSDVILGTNSNNTITFNGKINSDIIPFSSNVNLGNSTNSFGTVYIDDLITSGNLSFDDNKAITFGTNNEYSLYKSGDTLQFHTTESDGAIWLYDANNLVTLNFLMDTGSLTMTGRDSGDQGPQLTLQHLSSSPANNDEVADIIFRGYNDSDNNVFYGLIKSVAEDVTSGAEHGSFSFRPAINSASRHLLGLNIDSNLAVDLGYNGNQRLITTANGISVTGNINTSGVFVGNSASITANLSANGITANTATFNGNVNANLFVGALHAANNLSDIGNASTARTNLGLGSAATRSMGTGATSIRQNSQNESYFAPQANTIGYNQQWQNVTGSRTHSTNYQNTTGKPIQISITATGSTNRDIEVSTNGSTWVPVAFTSQSTSTTFNLIIPPGHYYRIAGSLTINVWAELR